MTTRVLLQCAVFAAVQVLLYLSVVPFTGALAAAFPPAYAVLAGVNSVMVFSARLFTGRWGAATLTALITGLLVAAVSPIGLLLLVSLTIAAAAFDLTLLVFGATGARRRSASSVVSVIIAGAVSAFALFVVSLPVFSVEHLTAGMLAATFVGRVAGQLAAAYCAVVLVRVLSRAGVRSAPVSPTLK